MAEQYPQNWPLTVDDERYGHLPYPHSEFRPTERTTEYIAGLNPSEYSYDHDYHHHHHHHRHAHGLPPLTIRRHAPGSNDPTLQRYPPNIYPSANVTSSSQVNVTIKRNPIPPDQTVIQPLLYPVAVYVNPPPPPPPPPPAPPAPPVIPYPVYQPIQYVQPIEQPVSPIKISSPPPVSPERYETEILSPPPRTQNISPRRPVRLDQITPVPPTFEPQKIRPSKFVVEEYDGYKEEYRAPSIYTIPEKVISYRTVPGRTTREIQNEELDYSDEIKDQHSPAIQTITYRTS